MAAGKGTRMRSPRPKVLHELAGRALLHHVLETAAALTPRCVVLVLGHGATEIRAARADWTGAAAKLNIQTVLQDPPLGTGHAVQQAVPQLDDAGLVLVLSGDVPLIQPDTLRRLVACARQPCLALLSVELDDPSGYGRIVRQGDAVRAIVEHKDATDAQRALREVYSGMMVAPTAWLKRWLAQLTPQNAQGEYYLTDVVAHAVAEGAAVQTVRCADPVQVQGINSMRELAQLERAFQLRQAQALMDAGVQLADPARLDVRGTLHCDAGVQIDVGCIFEGMVELGQGVRVGAHCVVRNARIEAGAVIHPFTHIEGGAPHGKQSVRVGPGALVGPFARLRPGADLGPQVHIGNFVEVKNSSLAAGAKANHLAYLGDAQVGERVNYGAGSITANYDGANKHRTVIEADVHVGSNCVLIAPVTLGAGGTVGGGSTITKSTPAGALSVARARQVSIANWQRPRKAPKS